MSLANDLIEKLAPGFMLVKVQPKSAFPGLLLHGKGIDEGTEFGM